MNTDDLIRAMAADSRPAPGMRQTLVRLLPMAILGVGAVMGATLGMRPDAAAAMPAIGMKLSITLSLFVTALVLAVTGASLSRALRLKSALWVAPVLAGGFALADLATNGVSGSLARLVGTHWSHCLMLIPVMAALPLLAMIAALRRGMPDHPARAGALAGLAAAGIGASFYALNCVEDSPLFVGFWYSLAALMVAAAGAWIGARWLRW